MKHLILGVLEHYQSGDNKGHSVRVAFYEENGQWKAFPTDFDRQEQLSEAVRSFPKVVTWIMCFDGRPLGSLVSNTPKNQSLCGYWCPADHVQGQCPYRGPTQYTIQRLARRTDVSSASIEFPPAAVTPESGILRNRNKTRSPPSKITPESIPNVCE